jgi:hypothetical protein
MATTWDSAFETSPADTDEIKYGAGKIRELKTAISEREELEHDFKSTGKHKPGKCSVLYKGTTTEINALTGMSEGAIAYDETLQKMKIYESAAWAVLTISPIPAGTKMLFYQDTAPTGWTIENTLNDKLVFITKGSAAGGQTGGAAHSTGSWTISGFSANVGSHTLTIAEMPSHTHTYSAPSTATLAGSEGPAIRSIVASTTGAAGGGAGHVHPMATHDGTWRPAAYNCIIATKD